VLVLLVVNLAVVDYLVEVVHLEVVDYLVEVVHLEVVEVRFAFVEAMDYLAILGYQEAVYMLP
jgi:hypothetical protein